MDIEKVEYNKIKEQRRKTLEEIYKLEETEEVRRYLELKEQESDLKEQEDISYKKMKKKNYKDCRHITIYTKIFDDYYEGKTYREVGCIKCGVDTSVLDYEKKYLSLSDQAIFDYVKSYSNVLFSSKPTVSCDLSLATSIYSKILEKNPGIDDKLARKYFEIALDNIRNIKVSDERKRARAKRLGLRNNFNNWNIEDIRKSN